MIKLNYKILNTDSSMANGYSLTSIRKEDIFKIKEWRNNQMDVLRQSKELTDKDQLNYYNNIVFPEFHKDNPTQILLSFLFKGICIGYGGLTNIDWASKRAEVSFLLDDKRILDEVLYKTDFSVFIKLLKDIAFNELSLNRLFTETFDIRPLHISLLEENGFIFEGRMKEHVCIQGEFVDSLIHGCLDRYN